MKKRIRLVVLLVLAIITAALLWKFVPWATLKARYGAFFISDLPPVWYYSSVVIIALLLMTLIWFVLQIVPKRQAQALQKPEKKRLADKLEVDEDGSLYTLQSSLKPSELFTIENEARKTLSQIIGGFIVIVSLILTGANLAITSRLTQEGQITDRFTKAITQLGDKDKLEVRLGGIYALERIANDSEKDRWTIMEVLTAYVRENAPRKEEKPAQQNASKKNQAKEEIPIPKLPTDIQAILTVIGRRNADGEANRIDLKRTNLFEADLGEANLLGANLFGANLRGAILFIANLRGAHLGWANLQRANLFMANLFMADLREADLRRADLREAILSEADLQGVNLGRADLSRADLSEAKNLTWEQLSKAIIDNETKLPPEIEDQHKDELKAMREKTRKEIEGN
ncbi:MAG: pentapeptide repeat-containing protein [Acidobacteria bacterium]|nr:pentapeptide repeat-containing protein [Acidobacteriota bacterium]